MITELINNKIEKPKKLDSADFSYIASEITRMWDVYNTGADDRLEDIENLRELIYQKGDTQIVYGEDITLPDLYEMKETYTSHLAERMYQTNEGVFDVKGGSEDAEKDKQIQKADIVSDMHAMGFRHIMDKIVEEAAVSGEFIARVGYGEVLNHYKRRRSELVIIESQNEETGELEPIGLKTENGITLVPDDIILEKGLAHVVKANETHLWYKTPVKSGVYVDRVKSTEFCFDVQFIDDFSKANKIHKHYESIMDILNNETYNMDEATRECFERLQDTILRAETASDKDSIWEEYTPAQTREIKGGQISVMEFYGTIQMPDGSILKSYNFVTALGKVLKYEQVDFDPFVYYPVNVDPDWKRGFSDLRVAVSLNAINSNIINKLLDIAQLVANPPHWAAKGSIKDGKQKMAPGANLEFDPTEWENPPKQVEVSGGLRLFEFIGFFKDAMQQATGITPNLIGVVNEEQKTATEINAAQMGAGVRQSYKVDKIQRGFNIPLVEKIAEVKRLCEFDKKVVTMTKEDGSQEKVIVDNNIRNANYEYLVVDTKTASRQRADMEDLLKFIQMFVDSGIMDVKEVYKFGLGMFNVPNSEKFLKSDQLDEMISKYLETIPENQRQQAGEQIKTQLAQVLGQMLQGGGNVQPQQ